MNAGVNTAESNCSSSCSCEIEENFVNRRKGRGAVSSGLTHECGVFGAIGTGEWPTNLEIAQIICWGLVALQHR